MRKNQKFAGAMAAIASMFFVGCSCAPEDVGTLAPRFALEGEAVGVDPDGVADYAIDFGIITVGSRHSPQVFVANAGNTTLTVRAESGEELEEPFSLSTTSLELRQQARRPLEVTMAPKSEGDFSQIIEFATNERVGKRTVRLMGKATQSRLVCTPSEVDIGHVVIGESRTGQISCTNNLDISTTITLGDFVGAFRSYFRAEIQGMGDGVTAELAPGAAVSIEVQFTADNVSGAASVSLPILDPSGSVVDSIHVSANAVDYALQVLYENENGERVPLSGCFTFPDTDTEMEEFGSLWVRNVSRNPVQIVSAALESESEHFSYLGPSFAEGKTVAPDSSEEVELPFSFHPKTAQNHSVNLIVQGQGTRAAPLRGLHACVQGQGGGARISCMPSEIQFGPVAWDMKVTRSYKCTNSAIVREGATPQVLYVTGVNSSDISRFTADIRNLDGSDFDPSVGYFPGEEFWVDVTYAPQGPEESFDTAIITVVSGATATPSHETSVSGQGRNLPPCDFEIAPQNLRFGVVAPNTQRTLAGYVVNRSETHECIVSDLRLSEDTDAAFSMEPIETAIIPPRPLPGSEDEGTEYRFPVEVTFAPTEVASFSGSVEFYISNPADPRHSIPLSGIGRRPCLEYEESIDFGAAPPMCAGREFRVSVRNACAEDLWIDQIFIEDAYPQFVIREVPILPMPLVAGDQMTFTAYFRPDGIGDFRGAITLELHSVDADGEPVEDLTYQIETKGQGQHDAIQTDSYTQADRAKVDVLWVIDNSGSMGQEQPLIQNKIPLFMQFAIDQNIDFHIGVTTTGVALHGLSACTAQTGFSDNEDGRLVPHPDLGRARILKSNMPYDELVDTFAANVNVGICHAYEAVYHAAYRALSDPWINTPLEDTGNQGFLRRDAGLSIIGVTDEPDTDSPWPVLDYIDFFRKLKPAHASDSVKVHMISGGYSSCSSNMGNAMACPRCVQGTEETGGIFVEICMDDTDPRWDEAFLEMSEGAFGFDSAFILRGQPAGNTVEVKVNGRITDPVTPTGARVWRYNSENNSVAFTPLFVPGANQVIEITYEVACVQYE